MTILHVGSIDAQILSFLLPLTKHIKDSSLDSHQNTDRNLFEHQFTRQLIPSIPSNSVLYIMLCTIVDNCRELFKLYLTTLTLTIIIFKSECPSLIGKQRETTMLLAIPNVFESIVNGNLNDHFKYWIKTIQDSSGQISEKIWQSNSEEQASFFKSTCQFVELVYVSCKWLYSQC